MWTWSELDEEQVRLLEEAERELGGDYLLAYRPADPGRDRAVAPRLTPAALDETQLRRVQELEREVGCIAVAYEPD
jgi:hypothetical protein